MEYGSFNLGGRKSKFGSIDIKKLQSGLKAEDIKDTVIKNIFMKFAGADGVLDRADIDKLQEYLAGIDLNNDGVISNSEGRKIVEDGKKIGSEGSKQFFAFLKVLAEKTQGISEVEVNEDGAEITNFDDGHKEKVYPNGTKEVITEKNGIKTTETFVNNELVKKETLSNDKRITENYKNGRLSSTVTISNDGNLIETINYEDDRNYKTVEDKESGTTTITDKNGNMSKKILEDGKFVELYENGVLAESIDKREAGKTITTRYNNSNKSVTTESDIGTTVENYEGENLTSKETSRTVGGREVITKSFVKDGKQVSEKYVDGAKIEQTIDGRTVRYDSEGNTLGVIVQNGESVPAIAKKFGVTKEALIEANKDQIKYSGSTPWFKVGAEIKIPREVSADDEAWIGRSSREDAINAYNEDYRARKAAEEAAAEAARREAEKRAEEARRAEEDEAAKEQRERMNSVAEEFYNIADKNMGIISIRKMADLVNQNINSSNIVDFLLAYENHKHGDSSVIDTIISEVGASGHSEQKALLFSILNKLCEAARNAGVSEDDIQSLRKEFEDSYNKEYRSLKGAFRKTDPQVMENVISTLTGLILAEQNKTGESADTQEAMQTVAGGYKDVNDKANKEFEESRETDGWAAKTGDWVCGLFGCHTVDELRDKLGDNAAKVEKLAEAADSGNEAEFRKIYKELFGIEFDPERIEAAEAYAVKYQGAYSNKATVDIIDGMLSDSAGDYNTLAMAIKEKFEYTDEDIASVIAEYAENYECDSESDEGKLEILKDWLNIVRSNSEIEYKELTRGKTLDEMGQEYDLILSSAYGTNDISKAVKQFNQNMVVTDTVVTVAAEIAGTVALSFVPVAGEIAAAKLAATAGRLVSKGVKVAKIVKYAEKCQKACSVAQKIQAGTKFAAKAGKAAKAVSVANKATRIGATAATAATATFVVDLSDKKSVSEALHKALMNGAFAGGGGAAAELAPKLAAMFGLADKQAAVELAEWLMDVAASYGVTQASGADYTSADAFIDFAADMIMARFGHMSVVRHSGNAPAPKPGVDVPAPKPDVDIPNPKPDVDVPAPKPESDVPAPKADTPDADAPKAEVEKVQSDAELKEKLGAKLTRYYRKIEKAIDSMKEFSAAKYNKIKNSITKRFKDFKAEMNQLLDKLEAKVKQLRENVNSDSGQANNSAKHSNIDPEYRSNGNEINRDEFVRNAGNGGNPYPEKYIQASIDLRKYYEAAIEKGIYSGSYQEYIDYLCDAHKVAYAGADGKNSWYSEFGNGGLDVNPGEIRGQGSLSSNRIEAGDFVEGVAKKYGDKYSTNTASRVELDGIPAAAQPNNIGYKHVYPDGKYLSYYFEQMQRTAQEALDLINKGAPQDRILAKLAEHYQYAANARPFGQINNSLFMNEINTFLSKAGMKTMPHGMLDHAAQRLQPETFKKYFIDEYKRTALDNISQPNYNLSLAKGQRYQIDEYPVLKLANTTTIDLSTPVLKAWIDNLPEGGRLTIGRAGDFIISDPSARVSRIHVIIEKRNGKIYIIDNSTNGTSIVKRTGDVEVGVIAAEPAAQAHSASRNAIQQSQNFNATHKVGVDEVIMDGYKDGGRHLRFDEYGNPINNPNREIIVVDRTRDTQLQSIISDVKRKTRNMSDKKKAAFLQDYVYKLCGDGRAADKNCNSWTEINKGREVLLGDIVTQQPPIAVCRHRSLLLKILGDEVGLKVELQRGNFNNSWGSGGHAWNVIKFEDGTSAIYDAMHNKTSNTTPGHVDNYAQYYYTVDDRKLYEYGV